MGLNQSRQNYFGECHSLRIYSPEAITYFCLRGTDALMGFRAAAEEPQVVPGSMKRNTARNEGVFTHTLTFAVPAADSVALRNYGGLSARSIVAVFVDERGTTRVIGSHLYPARLTSVEDSGMLSCRIEAWSTGVMPRLAN